MPLASHFSVLSSSVLMIAKAIDSYGCDSRELFHRAGLDHDRLTQPLARFSYGALQRLWVIAQDTTGDPCFSLRVASFWHPTTFHALGYSWLASRNLEEAFERLVRYSSVVSTATKGALRIEKSRDSFCLVADTERTTNPRSASSVSPRSRTPSCGIASSSQYEIYLMPRNLVNVIFCLVLAACASTGVDKSMPPVGATECVDPRPEVCTMDYRPVCGTHKDGSIKTYPNGCGACSNPEVTFWTEGACPE